MMKGGGKTGGYPGSGGGQSGGYPGSGGGQSGGYPGSGGGKTGGYPGSGGGQSGGYPGSGGGYPGPGGQNSGRRNAPAAPQTLAQILGAAKSGSGSGEPMDHAITLKAVTDTTLVSNTGGQSATTRTASLKSKKTTKTARKRH